MPYIKQDRRQEIDFGGDLPITAGELTYVLTRVIEEFLQLKIISLAQGMKFDYLHAAIGALECAKLELYRRIAAPYEDMKRVENGDVYHTGIGKTAENTIVCAACGTHLSSNLF
jgi:hypothetical protein